CTTAFQPKCLWAAQSVTSLEMQLQSQRLDFNAYFWVLKPRPSKSPSCCPREPNSVTGLKRTFQSKATPGGSRKSHLWLWKLLPRESWRTVSVNSAAISFKEMKDIGGSHRSCTNPSRNTILL